MPTKRRRDGQQHQRKRGVERKSRNDHQNTDPRNDLENQGAVSPTLGSNTVAPTPADASEQNPPKTIQSALPSHVAGMRCPSVRAVSPETLPQEPSQGPTTEPNPLGSSPSEQQPSSQECSPSSQYTPRPFVSDVYCNRGFFGNVRAYRVGDFNDLLSVIQGKAQQHYDVLAPTRVKVTTPTGTMESWDAFQNYKGLEERLCFASTAQFETSDGLVKCEVYVGRPEDVLTKYHHMERSDALKTKAVRVGKKVAKNVGVMIATSLVGRALRRVSPLLGIIIREGGSLYGKSGNFTTIYDELVPTPVCTVMVSPTDRPDTEFTREKNDAYLSFVKSLGAFRYLSR